MTSPMAEDLPQRGRAYQPRARPWVSQGPRSPRSEGTPHPDARRALAPSTSLRRSFRTHGLAAKLTPGRCPGLICRAPLGHPRMPLIGEGQAPQAIRPRLRVPFRPHRPRAGSLLVMWQNGLFAVTPAQAPGHALVCCAPTRHHKFSPGQGPGSAPWTHHGPNGPSSLSPGQGPGFFQHQKECEPCRGALTASQTVRQGC